MENIKESFKNIFSGEKIVTTHIILFVLCSILSIAGGYFETLKESKEIPTMGLTLTGLAIIIVIGTFLQGYAVKFTHNAFKNDTPMMPDVDMHPYKIFFNILPLYLVWGAYYIAASIIFMMIAFPLFSLGALGMTIFGLLVTAFMIVSAFVSFVFIAYSKDYNKEGLFNIMLPIKYMKAAFKDVFLLILKFIPLTIMVMIPSFLIGTMAAVMGPNMDKNLIYLSAISGGYLGLIVQLMWYYCSAKIYQDKMEDGKMGR